MTEKESNSGKNEVIIKTEIIGMTDTNKTEITLKSDDSLDDIIGKAKETYKGVKEMEE